ncbi:hypothetical protein QBC43DRAFT_294542 [Cladorrhinum sp. PSN259]|nr:hypothetical protein QBC43DRAFT_294542 [Cladorrhinum sp. PSN259]
MLNRVLSSALRKLADRLEVNNDGPPTLPPRPAQESGRSAQEAAAFPTLSFPPPPPAGSGTRRICARCLTLLRHVVFAYGNGTAYQKLEMVHYPAISALSGSS